MPKSSQILCSVLSYFYKGTFKKLPKISVYTSGGFVYISVPEMLTALQFLVFLLLPVYLFFSYKSNQWFSRINKLQSGSLKSLFQQCFLRSTFFLKSYKSLVLSSLSAICYFHHSYMKKMSSEALIFHNMLSKCQCWKIVFNI